MCLYVKSPTYSDALLRIFQGNGALSSIALKKSIGVYEGLPLGVYACGDSIGVYAEEYPSKYYAFDSFIPKYAAAKRATLVNDCVSGYEIAQAQTKLTAAISTYGSADLCILHVGINNIINAASDPSTAMQSPMTTLISDATGFASKVVVVGVHKYDTYKSSWVDNFNAWLSAHCASLENVTYIDADALWWDSDAGSVVPEYFPEDDYIHPNIAGHAALAEHIASLVQIEPNIPEYVATTDAPKSNGVGPDWADFDGVDDMMAIAAPGAAYNACTIIQSLKDVGHVTSTAQDISAGRTLNTDNWCGEIIVPSGSSLTAEELALLEKYADKIGGL